MSLAAQLESMAIQDILSQYPQTKDVFESYGLAAYTKTKTAQHETLTASALVHQVDAKALLAALVKTIEG